MIGIIDRFEGKFAIVEMDDYGIIEVEKEKIPATAKEGDVLSFGLKITIDEEETLKRQSKNRKFLELWEE